MIYERTQLFLLSKHIHVRKHSGQGRCPSFRLRSLYHLSTLDVFHMINYFRFFTGFVLQECNADTKTLDFRSLVIGFHSLGLGHWVPVQSSGTRVAGIQCGPGPRFKSIVFTVSQSIYRFQMFFMVCTQQISCANIVDGSSRLHNPQHPP